MFNTPPNRTGADSGLQGSQGSSAASPLGAGQAEDLDLLPSYRSILRAQQEAGSKSHRRETLRKAAGIGAACMVAAVAAALLYTQWPRLSRLASEVRRSVAPETAPSAARESKPAAPKPRRQARLGNAKKPERAASQPAVAIPEEATSRPPVGPYQFEITDALSRRWLVISSTPEVFAPIGSRPGPAHIRLAAPEEEAAAPRLAEPASLEAGNTTPAGEELSLAIVGPLTKDQPANSHELVTQHRIESGSVVLAAEIGPDGTARNVRVVSGPPVLVGAVFGLLRQLRFALPEARDGVGEPERLIRVDVSISSK